MSIWKSIGNFAKKAVKIAAPIASIAAPFLPGIGPAIGGIIGKIGDSFGGTSAKTQTPGGFVGPPDPNAPQRVEVTGQSMGTNWGKAIGDALPSLATGAMNYFGQAQANAASAQQAQRQMDFQASQTGTSYQRGVADMKAAGLNPMLAYSQGGAASGGGAMAMQGNELGAGANSAVSTATAVQNLKNMAAQEENTLYHTDKVQADTDLVRAQTRTETNRPENLIAQTAMLKAQGWSQDMINKYLERVQIANLQQTHSATQANLASAGLSRAKIPEASNRSSASGLLGLVGDGVSTLNSAKNFAAEKLRGIDFYDLFNRNYLDDIRNYGKKP